MAKNAFLQKIEEERKTYLYIGIQCGRQQILDMLTLALRDPDVMGKDTFGKDRLLRVIKSIGEKIDIYQKAWEKNDETDYYRAKLDEALAEAYGGDLIDSFSKRYEYAPDYDYKKGKWKR
jgi:hypothetical protein